MRRAVRSSPPLAGLAVVSILALVALVGARRVGNGAPAPFVGPAPSTVDDRAHLGRPHPPGHQRLVPPAAGPGRGAGRRAPGRHLRPSADGHAHGSGHLFGPAPEADLSPADADRFAQQWAAAKAAVPSVDTTAKAAAAGYVLSSTPAPGVGVHWVNWQLISQPFDPARPAMLLFSGPLGNEHLVGFSYWVQGTYPPDGFAGSNDQWHTHAGLCVVNGWVEREERARPGRLPGQLAGRRRPVDAARLGGRPLPEPLGSLRPDQPHPVPDRARAGPRLLHAGSGLTRAGLPVTAGWTRPR